MAALMIFAALVGGVSDSSPTPPQLAAMETVSERLFGYYLKFSLCNQASCCDNGGCSSTCNDSLVFSKTLQENGSWPDINYDSKKTQPVGHSCTLGADIITTSKLSLPTL